MIREDSDNKVLLFQLMFTRNGDTPSVTKNVHSSVWVNPIMSSSVGCETLIDTSETIINYHIGTYACMNVTYLSHSIICYHQLPLGDLN